MDVSCPSPSRRVNFSLLVGTTNVRFGVIPHFTLGSVADVSGPASPGGDSIVVIMGNVNGWFDVRRPEIGDVGIASPSCRMSTSATGDITNSVACAQQGDIIRSAAGC